jgi:hypothetical protein
VRLWISRVELLDVVTCFLKQQRRNVSTLSSYFCTQLRFYRKYWSHLFILTLFLLVHLKSLKRLAVRLKFCMHLVNTAVQSKNWIVCTENRNETKHCKWVYCWSVCCRVWSFSLTVFMAWSWRTYPVLNKGKFISHLNLGGNIRTSDKLSYCWIVFAISFNFCFHSWRKFTYLVVATGVTKVK